MCCALCTVHCALCIVYCVLCHVLYCALHYILELYAASAQTQCDHTLPGCRAPFTGALSHQQLRDCNPWLECTRESHEQSHVVTAMRHFRERSVPIGTVYDSSVSLWHQARDCHETLDVDYRDFFPKARALVCFSLRATKHTRSTPRHVQVGVFLVTCSESFFPLRRLE